MAYHRISMSQSNQIQRCLLSFALNVTLLKRNEIMKNKIPNLVENFSCVFIRIVNSLIRVLYIFLDLQKMYVCMYTLKIINLHKILNNFVKLLRLCYTLKYFIASFVLFSKASEAYLNLHKSQPCPATKSFQ